MKIVLTGAAGNITRPLAQKLLAQGHGVTVIGRRAENLKSLADQGATPAVGSIEDEAFLTEAFKGADAVYTMVPVPYHAPDWVAYGEAVGNKYARAIKANDVRKVVNLSTYGAHRLEGIGPVNSIGQVEKALNALQNATVIHLRAGYFYTNLVAQIPAIKNRHTIGSNYGHPEKTLLLVHTKDIAEVAAEALTNHGFNSEEPYYIVSDVRSYADVAAVIGKAIGKDDLKWTPLSDDELRHGLRQSGFPDGLINIYAEIGQSLANGRLNEHYLSLPAKPALGQTKLEEYAREFAAAYQQSK
ncbi:MAG: NAD(P)H-binding protein [Ferruginibacter sp.]|nr:NAD(P)H-binding protein [Cytophagales bacterium]